MFKVGPSSPGSAVRTLGGEIELGFEVWLSVTPLSSFLFQVLPQFLYFVKLSGKGRILVFFKAIFELCLMYVNPIM